MQLGKLTEAQEERPACGNLVLLFQPPDQHARVGTERLEAVIWRAGRRMALAVSGGAAVLGAAIAATSTHLVVWVPAGLGALGAVFIVALLLDLVRSRDLPPGA